MWPPLLPRSDAVYGNAEPLQVRSVESLTPLGVGNIWDISSLSLSWNMKFGEGDLLVLL